MLIFIALAVVVVLFYVYVIKKSAPVGMPAAPCVADFVAAGVKIEDAELAKRIYGLRDAVVTILGSSKNAVCSHKSEILDAMLRVTDNIKANYKQNPTQMDAQLKSMCALSSAELTNKIVQSQPPRMLSSYPLFDTLRSDVDSVVNNLNVLLVYVVQKKLCAGTNASSVNFQIDMFERYIRLLIDGMCASDDWKTVTTQQIDYILAKPASYLFK